MPPSQQLGHMAYRSITKRMLQYLLLACTGETGAVDALQAQNILRIPQWHARMIPA